MKLKLKPFFWLFLFLSNFSFSQTNLQFGERIIVGNSLTYLTKSGRNLDNRLHVFVWNKDISVNLNKALYFGMSYENYYVRGSVFSNEKQNENYYAVGFFLQYDLTPKYKDRLFAKISLIASDYCACNYGDPYRDDNLIYGVSAGYDFPIHEYISIDMDFGMYQIINPFIVKRIYVRYSIGLNFDFIKKRKKGFILKNIYK